MAVCDPNQTWPDKEACKRTREPRNMVPVCLFAVGLCMRNTSCSTEGHRGPHLELKPEPAIPCLPPSLLDPCSRFLSQQRLSQVALLVLPGLALARHSQATFSVWQLSGPGRVGPEGWDRPEVGTVAKPPGG